MKIRIGFVSNSSSSSYLVCLPQLGTKKIREMTSIEALRKHGIIKDYGWKQDELKKNQNNLQRGIQFVIKGEAYGEMIPPLADLLDKNGFVLNKISNNDPNGWGIINVCTPKTMTKINNITATKTNRSTKKIK